MLTLLGLSYRVPEFFVKSINSIVDNASEPTRIIVIDSKSDKSEKIAEIGKQFLLEGKIDTFVQASANCKGFGLWWAYRNFISEEDFIVMSDLDVIVPAGIDWIKRLREGIEGIDICGFSLDTVNYTSENAGHTEDGCGTWLIGLRKSYIDNNFKGESNVMDMSLWFGTTQRRKLGEKLYHQGWDLWYKNPEYYADKQKGTGWLDYVECDYKVTTKADLV